MRRVVRGFVFAVVAAQIAAPGIASHARQIADAGGTGAFATYAPHQLADAGGTGAFATYAPHQLADAGGTGAFSRTVFQPIA